MASEPNRFLELMDEMDRDKADSIKNKILDLLLREKTTSLIALSAVRCVATGLEEIINEQTGGEVVTVSPSPTQTERADDHDAILRRIDYYMSSDLRYRSVSSVLKDLKDDIEKGRHLNTEISGGENGPTS